MSTIGWGGVFCRKVGVLLAGVTGYGRGGGEGFNLGNKYGLTGPGLLLPQHAGQVVIRLLVF